MDAVIPTGTAGDDVGWERREPGSELKEQFEFLPPFKVAEILDDQIDPLGDAAHVERFRRTGPAGSIAAHTSSDSRRSHDRPATRA